MIAILLCVFQQGKKQKHWDNILHRVFGGVSDTDYMYELITSSLSWPYSCNTYSS